MLGMSILFIVCSIRQQGKKNSKAGIVVHSPLPALTSTLSSLLYMYLVVFWLQCAKVPQVNMYYMRVQWLSNRYLVLGNGVLANGLARCNST